MKRRNKTPGPPEASRLPPKNKNAHVSKRPEPAPIPEEVRKQFVQLKNTYFFPDGARAFTDRGDRLTTPSENSQVVQSLVVIAQARGWSEVVVRGSERFRREAWAAAQTAGLEVRGYKPTELERSRLVRSLAGRAVPDSERPGDSGSESHDREQRVKRGPRHSGLVSGTLIEHGRAPYRNDAKELLSYYVKIETPQGDRTIWGVDLERALRESLSKPTVGDAVGLRSIRQEAVKVKASHRDADGAVVGAADITTHRNRWIVEKQEFFAQRAEAARTLRDTSIDPKQGGRQHPELLGSYLQVRATELAAKQLRDPQDQKQFVEKVREALADSVARGEPLPPVRMREGRAPEVQARPARVPEPERVRA